MERRFYLVQHGDTLLAETSQRQGYTTQTGTKDEDEDEELLISHMIFPDIWSILASSRTMLLEMSQSAGRRLDTLLRLLSFGNRPYEEMRTEVALTSDALEKST